MRARNLGVLALAAVLALGATGCGDDDKASTSTVPEFAAGSTMKAIQDKGKLVVGTKFDQPSFGLKNPTTGEIEGFDVEIAKEIAKAIFGDASKVEFIESVSKNREPFIEEGKVDIVVATYTINATRKEKVAFAGPYYVAGQDIMVKSDNTTITGVESLAGKNVCSVQGSTSEKNLKEKAPTAKPVLFDTYSKCAEALGDGRVDAVTTDDSILYGLAAKSDGKYKVVGKTFTTEPYGIGLKKGADEWRTFINDLIEAMYKDGRWEAAFKKTVGLIRPDVPTPPAVDRY